MAKNNSQIKSFYVTGEISDKSNSQDVKEFIRRNNICISHIDASIDIFEDGKYLTSTTIVYSDSLTDKITNQGVELLIKEMKKSQVVL